MGRSGVLVVLVLGWALSGGCSAASGPWQVLAGPVPGELVVAQDGRPVARLTVRPRPQDPTPTVTLQPRIRDPRTLEMTWTLAAPGAPDQGGLSLVVEPLGGTVLEGPPSGTTDRVGLCPGPGLPGATLRTPSPVRVTSEGGLSLALVEGTPPAGTLGGTLTLTFPVDVRLLTGPEVDRAAPLVAQPGWFSYQPRYEGPSVLGMEGWLEAPAGRRGGVRVDGEGFRFEDGTPARFWGMNLTYADNAPPKAAAEATAARLARYGVNAVRLHKFTNPGWEGIGDPERSDRFTAEGLDRFDYLASRLAARGIYYGWSPFYPFKVRPGDRSRFSGFEELMAQGGVASVVANWAEDVQDAMIGLVVDLLAHRNPYTGRTYAQDPALNFIELQNEDDIFFYASSEAYRKFPTYRAQLLGRYAAWLGARYGGQEGLAAAWPGALKEGETLASASVALEPNPWFGSSANLDKSTGGTRQRLLDNAAFLHETQNRFYGRFVAAIRAAGYQGPVIGSNWQAPGLLPHYANLRSDALVGFVDRHAYFGGARDDTMMASPGSGLLGAGFDQVAGRPFGLSEWSTVYPSLYRAEAPFLVAAYGMGLQGWDSSYEFQTTSQTPDPLVGARPWKLWNGDAPNQIGQFPVLGRMVLRGDVKPGPVLSVRRVGPTALATGRFGFDEDAVPAEVLAMGRALVEFTEGDGPTTLADLAPYRTAGGIRSATGQLIWDPKARTVRVDTPGTQGYAGFTPGGPLAFADLTLATAAPYAVVLVTAFSPSGTLATDRRALVGVAARNANTGERLWAADGRTIIADGTAPILVEPVRVTLGFPRRPGFRVTVLDQDGRATPTVLVPDPATGTVLLDTGRDRALNYLVTFP